MVTGAIPRLIDGMSVRAQTKEDTLSILHTWHRHEALWFSFVVRSLAQRIKCRFEVSPGSRSESEAGSGIPLFGPVASKCPRDHDDQEPFLTR